MYNLLIILSLGLSYQAIPLQHVTIYPNYVTVYQDNWILAHNYLAGSEWDRILVGDALEYNGETYIVVDIYKFRAVEPHNPRTNLVSLDGGIEMTTNQVLEYVLCDDCLTLQTCIGDEWGRLFIKSEKVQVNGTFFEHTNRLASRNRMK